MKRSINVRLDHRLVDLAGERAARENVPRTTVLEDALRAYLTEKDPQDNLDPGSSSYEVCGICNKQMRPGQPTWEAHGERCHESCVKYGPPPE